MPISIFFSFFQRAYNEKEDVHRFDPTTVNGPTLPSARTHWASISSTGPKSHYQRISRFHGICVKAVGYVWRQSSTFGVRNWSVFVASVRTNNDLEGWHNRINSRMNSTGPVPLYLLQELYKEATAIPMQARLLTEGKLEMLHRNRATRHSNCGSSTTTGTLVQQSSSGSVPSFMDLLTCWHGVMIW